MPRFLKPLAAILVALGLAGCAGSYYNVPKERYVQKVRTLGILPILVDAGSDIRHPQKDEVVALIREFDRKNEKQLVAALRERGGYFMVTLLDGDADKLFDSLYFRRELRDDAGVTYNKYFFKQQEIRDLVKRSGVDAVLVIVVSGITKHDRIFSSNLMKYLDADYNSLIVTAQVLDADGTLLWEYPNFRQHSPSLPVFLPLQYPDFDEAAANMDEKVDIKFRTVAGLRRALEKQSKNYLFQETGTSEAYQKIFDDIVSLLRQEVPFFGGSDKNRPEPASTQPAEAPAAAAPAEAPKSAVPPAPAPAATPAAAPAASAEPAEKPLGNPEPIVETPVK